MWKGLLEMKGFIFTVMTIFMVGTELQSKYTKFEFLNLMFRPVNDFLKLTEVVKYWSAESYLQDPKKCNAIYENKLSLL
jgi:hypothetical protein